jgi:ribonuclease HI
MASPVATDQSAAPAQAPRVLAAACDGACSGNPGPGGWGCLLRFEDGTVQEFGGADPATTNNRMELTAALTLLQKLRELPLHPDLAIRTDSKYLIDGFSKWMPGWKRKGWRTASGGPVLNRDLWEALDAARLPGLPFRYVKGHSGDPDNDRCDTIAVAFSKGGRPALADGAPGGQRPAARRTRSSLAGAATAEASSTAKASSKAKASPAPAPSEAAESAPPALQQLLTRLELADRLAAGGYGLSLVELAQLVEMPLRTLEARQGPWPWRDWRVLPAGEGRWRLEREAAGSGRATSEDLAHG